MKICFVIVLLCLLSNLQAAPAGQARTGDQPASAMVDSSCYLGNGSPKQSKPLSLDRPPFDMPGMSHGQVKMSIGSWWNCLTQEKVSDSDGGARANQGIRMNIAPNNLTGYKFCMNAVRLISAGLVTGDPGTDPGGANGRFFYFFNPKPEFADAELIIRNHTNQDRWIIGYFATGMYKPNSAAEDAAAYKECVAATNDEVKPANWQGKKP